MADIVLTGDTSGAITVAAPAVAGTNTLTLPATTGNIMTTGDSSTITQGMIASNVAGTGPTFRAYMSTNFTLATGVQTKAPLNTEEWDTNSNYDNATNYRFTPTVAGYYIFTGAAFGSISTTARFGVSVYKNGGPASWGFNNGLTSDGGGSVVVSTILYANGSSDYFELYLLQNQGTNATIVSSNGNTWFSGSLIRSA